MQNDKIILSSFSISEIASAIRSELKAEINEIQMMLLANKSTNKHLNKREAAEALSCSVPMIDKLLINGRLDKIKVGAKVLIPRASIDRILSSKKG